MAQRGYRKALARMLKRLIANIAVFLGRFNTLIRIALLVILLCTFSVIGGLLFKLVESPVEDATIRVTKHLRETTLEELYTLFKAKRSDDEINRQFTVKMDIYEINYLKAIKNGTYFINGKPDPIWTFRGSTYFCVTTFTQLGFGNLAPKSLLGRVVCVIYACFSIPIGAIVFADLGTQINHLLRIAWIYVYRSLRNLKESATEDRDRQYKLSYLLAPGLTVAGKYRSGEKDASSPSSSSSSSNSSNSSSSSSDDATQTRFNSYQFSNLNTSSPAENTNTNTNTNNDCVEDDCPVQVGFQQSNLRRRRNNRSVQGMVQGCKRSANPNTDDIEATRKRLEPPPEVMNSFRLTRSLKQTSSTSRSATNRRTKYNVNRTTINTFLKGVVSSPCCPIILRVAFLKCSIYSRLRERIFPSQKPKASVAKRRKRGSPGFKHDDYNYSNSVFGRAGENDKNDENDDNDDDNDEKESVVDFLPTDPQPVIILNILLAICYLVLGTFICGLFENWPNADALWFLVISSLTIGYGDVTPKDTKFFAFFIPYLILGIAVFSNVIVIAMTLISNILIRASNIGTDVYATINTRSNYHHIERRSMRARRRWGFVRLHVQAGLPQKLIRESSDFKKELLTREKSWVREAFRLYFLYQYEDRYNELKDQIEKHKMESLTLKDEPGTTLKFQNKFTFVPIVSKEGDEMPPEAPKKKKEKKLGFFRRIKQNAARRYGRFREAVAPSPDFI